MNWFGRLCLLVFILMCLSAVESGESSQAIFWVGLLFVVFGDDNA